ncbi:hypothetical protein GNP89_16575 [Aliivibrio fischeri]|uniref:hypothetical protein n=1 Tax=Aliivibrio fischeri TaxID=668 RepID=UPI001327C893|nr:hypothetical protein [Aliivibrio fischeri]
MSNHRQQKLLEHFYSSLDENVIEELSEEQKESIERAIIATGLGSNNRVDIRKSISVFNKRYFFVFLLGRDYRQQLRKESPFALLMLTFLISIGIFCILGLAIFALYLIKSALGIDIFHNFSFGVWDWFKELMQH